MTYNTYFAVNRIYQVSFFCFFFSAPTDADFSQVIKMTYSNADAVINQDEKNAYINSILNTLLPAVNTFIEERATECTREGRDVRVNVTIADVDTDIVETVDTVSNLLGKFYHFPVKKVHYESET